MDSAERTELVDLLTTLRREGRQQSGLESRLQPADREAGYRVAQMVAEALGWAVAGCV